MKISVNWLRDFIDLPDSAEAIADRLTLSGLEVEGIEHYEQITGGLAGLVIGEVLSVKPHPNADRLQLTTVDVGQDEPLPIVCGAPNVAAGQRVVVATVGATLHPVGGESFVIKKAKIRGEASQGMICAEDEIGLGTGHDGIMVLTTDLPNGTPATDYFRPVADTVLEIGLTPNRADAASHLGVARDLKALYRKPLTLPPVEKLRVDNQRRPVRVTVENAEACPRYSGVTLCNVRVQDSPDWLQNRLRAIGLQPINNVVDATNYVMHELGQPLHAFDADAIAGDEVIVRTLPAGSTFMTLDGKNRTLQADDLMICNAEGGMCIAGVFGGIKSGVKDTTTNIFLESAYFAPEYIRRTAQHHSLKTDASFRYERGTDPNMTVFALKRAILLIQEVAGGEVSSEIVDVFPAPVSPFRVAVKYAHVDRLIGKVIDREEIKAILTELDIILSEEDSEGLVVMVPPYRVDVQREADIIEEILRIYGYDQVPVAAHLKTNYLASFPETDGAALRAKVSEMLVGNGFYEIITNSLTRPAYAEALHRADRAVTMVNALSEDLSMMRQSLLFSGLEVIAHNVNRQQKNLKLFEFGTTYEKLQGKYVETNGLAIFMTGQAQAESWMTSGDPVSFHHLSSLIRNIFNRFGIDDPNQNEAELLGFDYGLQYLYQGQILADIGLVNSSFASLAGVQQPVFYANVHWPRLVAKVGAASQKGRLMYQPISKFPEVRRDLSLVLSERVPFSRVEEVVKQASSQLVRQINVFDIYKGEQLAEGEKAYALSFILQDQDKTLTDALIEKTMNKLMNTLKHELNATIRK
ncbi:MAG: phenylalanine--tRNA ligase subunit beta [Tunicatimonas sp.]